MKPTQAIALRNNKKLARKTYREVQELQEDVPRLIMMPTRDKAPITAGWRKLDKTYDDSGWERCNGYGIICGKKTGLMVIDVDNKGDTVAWFDRFVEHFNLEPTTWVNTPSGGYHLYYEYTDAITGSDFGAGTNIDLRTEGHYIMGPNSYYFVDRKAVHKETGEPKNKEKFKYEGLQYVFKEVNDEVWDFEMLKPLPEVFVRLKKYGINRETMEFGKKCLVSQTQAQRKTEVSDQNKRLFIDLMKAYTKYTKNSRTQWLHGLWSVAVVSKEYFWDAEKVAVAWCSSIEKYEGPQEVIKKLKEFDPRKCKGFGLKYILRRVSDEAREAFKDFERNFCYHDYNEIFKWNTHEMDRDIVKQYISKTFIRIDRMGALTWFTKHSSGQWRTITAPFKDEEINVFFKYKDSEEKKMTSLRFELCNHKLDWVRNFRDFTFHPYFGEDEAPPDDIFNSFTGYRHAALSEQEYDEKNEDFQFVMNHWFEYMCNKNREYYDYLMDWLAWVIQKGHRKPRTAIVMFSKQGIGKGLMWTDLVWQGVLGRNLAHSITDMETFTAKFNYERLYKCLHIFNECTSIMSGERVNWDKMKSIITDKEFRMEMKYKNAVMAEDCAGCVFLSNHEHCVKVEDDDRRYAVIESNTELPGADYYTRLADLVNSEPIQRLFFTFLARRDLSNFNFKNIPHTEARRECKVQAYRNTILLFLKQVVTGEAVVFADYDIDNIRFRFNWKENLELLPDKRWHSQQMLWGNYLRWLKENYPRLKAMGKPTIVKQLKKDGLEVSQRTCRTTRAIVICWRIDKDAVRTIYRNRLQDPGWDFESTS